MSSGPDHAARSQRNEEDMLDATATIYTALSGEQYLFYLNQEKSTLPSLDEAVQLLFPKWEGSAEDFIALLKAGKSESEPYWCRFLMLNKPHWGYLALKAISPFKGKLIVVVHVARNQEDPLRWLFHDLGEFIAELGLTGASFTDGVRIVSTHVVFDRKPDY